VSRTIGIRAARVNLVRLKADTTYRLAPIACVVLLGCGAATDQSVGGTATLKEPIALSPTPVGLSGTSWQLVEFRGGDDSRLTPDERAKYTIEFGEGGRVSVRIDCNRGGGTWTSGGPNHLQFGPLALTRAACPPGSLHDQIVKQWGFIRSYVMKDGHLFLSLMADGGIYEFEPPPKARR